MVREIEADAKAHGDERRTLVQEEKKALAEVKVVDEPVTVVVSAKGWVRALKGHEVDAADAGLQAGRRAVRHLRLPPVDTLLVFGTRQGQRPRLQRGRRGAARRARRRRADHDADRPGTRHAGRRIALPAPPRTTLLLANSGGFGLLAQAGDMLGRNRGGKSFLTLDDGCRLLPPVAVAAGAHPGGLPGAGRPAAACSRSTNSSCSPTAARG